MLKHSLLINGYDAFNLTKLDVLDALPEIKVGVAYVVDGQELEGFPGEGPSIELHHPRTLAQPLGSQRTWTCLAKRKYVM